MKQMVVTCVLIYSLYQWRLVQVELEVAHGRQADGS
jgi:hypothetical protein